VSARAEAAGILARLDRAIASVRPKRLARRYRVSLDRSCRRTGRAAQHVRIGDQPAGRKGDRLLGATLARIARQQSDRMNAICDGALVRK